MSGSVNKVVLIGNLGDDPKVRVGEKGAMATFPLATSERWTNAAGQRQERTEWHRVAVYGNGLTELCQRFLSKGSYLYLEGTLRYRSWVDDAEIKRYTTEVIVSSPRGVITMLGSGGGSHAGESTPPRPTPTAQDYRMTPLEEDAIPF